MLLLKLETCDKNAPNRDAMSQHVFLFLFFFSFSFQFPPWFKLKLHSLTLFFDTSLEISCVFFRRLCSSVEYFSFVGAVKWTETEKAANKFAEDESGHQKINNTII